MKKINCIIIDDEKPARKLIENYCKRIDTLQIVGEFKTPLEALSILKNTSIDLIFLDINMPEISGIEFIKTLDYKPYIILTTAYREYALDAFELGVLDYLLKPIEFPRFLKAVQKLGAQNYILQSTNTFEEEPYTFIKSNRRSYKLFYKNIILIQSNSEYLTYFTQDQGKFMVYGSLKNVELQLPSFFIRIHRSYIININKIKYVEGNRISISDTFLTIGESYKNSFFKKWNH